MGTLDGFRVFNFSEGVPYVSITANGMTFNKSVVMKLDYPPYVRLLINAEERKIAIQSCDKDETFAAGFYKPKESKVISVRWNGKDLLNTIQEIKGWNLKNESYRVDGILLKDEHAMLFDLDKAQSLT